MADSRAEYVFRRQEQLESERSTFDSHCKEVAERVLPRQDDFVTQRTVEGEKRTEKIFDSTALLALDKSASAIDSLVTPSTQMYHRLEPEDDALLQDKPTMVFCHELNKMLFRMRYRPLANFSSQAHECFVSLMAFGNLGMFTDDELGIGTRYKSIALSNMWFSENAAGIVDYVHRRIRMTARAAHMKWGNKLPEKIIKSAENKPFEKYDFLHCVKPNEERKSGAKSYHGMPWASYYCAYEGRTLLDEGGYRTLPYAISRHVTSPNEIYGRSPAMMVLPDIKMVNEMEKTNIRAGHKIVDPPLLAYGDGILSSFNARPNAVNYGAVDENGKQLVVPLKTGANLPIVLEMAEQKRQQILDAFYVTLFQILVRNPQMTATEALIRAQEKGQLLAPTVGRQQTEFLGNVITRELDIISMAGMLPPVPPKLERSGGAIKVVYTSPLTRLRRAEDGVAIARTLEGVLPLIEVKPEILDNFDLDELVHEWSDIHGVPPKIIRAREIVEQIRADRQQEEQAIKALAAAEQMAKTGKDVAKAQAEGAQPV